MYIHSLPVFANTPCWARHAVEGRQVKLSVLQTGAHTWMNTHSILQVCKETINNYLQVANLKPLSNA